MVLTNFLIYILITSNILRLIRFQNINNSENINVLDNKMKNKEDFDEIEINKPKRKKNYIELV